MHTMESYHQAFFGPNDPQIQQITNDGNHILEITRQLTRRYETIEILISISNERLMCFPNKDSI
jgi:hypothetical protein